MYLYVLLGLLSCSGMKAQTASDVQVIPVNFEQSTAYFTSLSDNGLWAVAVATDGENTGRTPLWWAGPIWSMPLPAR